MKEFKFGDYVWHNGSGWIYLGIDEDYAIQLMRPIEGGVVGEIEFDNVWMTDEDDYNQFLRDNGETLIEKCKRKKIEIPQKPLSKEAVEKAKQALLDEIERM